MLAPDPEPSGGGWVTLVVLIGCVLVGGMWYFYQKAEDAYQDGYIHGVSHTLDRYECRGDQND